MKTRVCLVQILVDNVEKAVNFYHSLFGWEISKKPPYNEILEQANGKVAFLDANGVYLELVEPTSGERLNYLKAKGRGYIRLYGVEVNDIEEFTQKIKELGITPVDGEGNPIEHFIRTTSGGAKVFLLPIDKTLGTKIEIIEWINNSGP